MFYICLSPLKMNEDPRTTFPEGVFIFSHIFWVVEWKILSLSKDVASGKIAGRGGVFFDTSFWATNNYY